MDRAAFLDRLSEYSDLTRDALRKLLPDGEPDNYLYGPMRDYLETSGKGIRPALMIATCRAFGGRTEDVLTSAAALELLHNAFLIHDDIEDESEFRRGRACMHERLGVPLAINIGDAMQAMALRLLRRNVADIGPDKAWRVYEEFDHLLMESLEGQALELGWIRDNDSSIGPSDYLRMTLKKTCWYSFIHPCRIGAIIARPDGPHMAQDELSAFDSFGFLLGTAFQIQDDVLNLVGRQDVYGKEIMGDIYEGKRTLMLTRLIGLAAPRERERLHGFLALPRGDRQEKDVVWVQKLMENYDCISYARKASSHLLEAAGKSFDSAFKTADGPDKEFVSYLMAYMIEREV